MNNKLILAIIIIVTLICVAWGGAKLQDCGIIDFGIETLYVTTECKF